MCHSRTWNNRINKFHESDLQFVYGGRQSRFEELISEYLPQNSLSICNKIVQDTSRTIMKCIMNGIFKIRYVKYNFRIASSFPTRTVKYVNYGSEKL